MRLTIAGLNKLVIKLRLLKRALYIYVLTYKLIGLVTKSYSTRNNARCHISRVRKYIQAGRE